MEDRVKTGGRRRLADIESSAFDRALAQFEKHQRSNFGSVKDVLDHKHVPFQGRHHNFSVLDEATHFDRHMVDALMYGTSAMQTGVVAEDPLAKFKDHELIMALLKRGYAAMKLPADGGPPEVLRK